MFTYVFHRPADGLTKIGKSTSPISRLMTLSSQHGPLSPVAVIGGDSEKSWHSLHAACRIEGEWFRLSEAKIEDHVHARLRELAKAEGRLIGHLVSDLINEAIEARADAAAKKSKSAAK